MVRDVRNSLRMVCRWIRNTLIYIYSPGMPLPMNKEQSFQPHFMSSIFIGHDTEYLCMLCFNHNAMHSNLFPHPKCTEKSIWFTFMRSHKSMCNCWVFSFCVLSFTRFHFAKYHNILKKWMSIKKNCIRNDTHMKEKKRWRSNIILAFVPVTLHPCNYSLLLLIAILI